MKNLTNVKSYIVHYGQRLYFDKISKQMHNLIRLEHIWAYILNIKSLIQFTLFSLVCTLQIYFRLKFSSKYTHACKKILLNNNMFKIVFDELVLRIRLHITRNRNRACMERVSLKPVQKNSTGRLHVKALRDRA